MLCLAGFARTENSHRLAVKLITNGVCAFNLIDLGMGGGGKMKEIVTESSKQSTQSLVAIREFRIVDQGVFTYAYLLLRFGSMDIRVILTKKNLPNYQAGHIAGLAIFNDIIVSGQANRAIDHGLVEYLQGRRANRQPTSLELPTYVSIDPNDGKMAEVNVWYERQTLEKTIVDPAKCNGSSSIRRLSVASS